MRCLFPFAWLLTALVAQAYTVGSSESLAAMSSKADLVCKAKVIAITHSGRNCEARLQLITVFKGEPGTNQIRFLHNGTNWARGLTFITYTPQYYDLQLRQSYLIFALKGTTGGDYRQIRESHTSKMDNGVLSTLDDRPLKDVSIQEAHWLELNLLLTNSTPSDALYAIEQLNSMTGFCERNYTNCPSHQAAYRWHKPPAHDWSWGSVAPVLIPQFRHTNDAIAIAAMKLCKRGGCLNTTNDFAPLLVEQAGATRSVARRTTAMSMLRGRPATAFATLLPAWLTDASEEVRTAATFLLSSLPASEAMPLVRQQVQDAAANVRDAAAQVAIGTKMPEVLPVLAKDSSPTVRAAAAGSIATGKFKELIPELLALMNDPTGVTNKLGLNPNDAGSLMNYAGPVRTAAAYALLSFPVEQVEAALKANLNDDYFKPAFLARLSATNPVAWMTELGDVVERRLQPCNWGQGGRSDPVFYSNPYWVCFSHLWIALSAQPNADILAGKFDRYFQALENGGMSVAGELERIYAFYLGKGMLERAAKYKDTSLKKYGPRFEQGFQRVERNVLGRNAPAAP